MKDLYEVVYDELYRGATNDVRFNPTQLATMLDMPVDTPREKGISSQTVTILAAKHGTRIGNCRVNNGEGEMVGHNVYAITPGAWHKFMYELIGAKGARKRGMTRLGRVEAKLDSIEAKLDKLLAR